MDINQSRTHVVLTLTGADRVGLVHDITERLLALGGNVETSRAARLGGEFAVLMLVSLPAAQISALEAQFAGLTAKDYKVTITPTQPAPAAAWRVYRIEVQGADHEGIIHDLAHHLSQRGINIETMDTSTRPAPVSGTPLFSMSALVAVPPDLDETAWVAELDEAGQKMNVDVDVMAAEG